jgi:hypothetical protein
MKAFLLLLGVAAAGLLLAACESDVADGTEVPQKFQRGIRGNGTLYQPDRSADPMIREESRVGD